MKSLIVVLALVGLDRDRVLDALPEIADTKEGNSLRDDLYDSRTFFYNEDTCPKAYQHDSGVHWAHYNISGGADRVGRGNANVEFPWNVGGGLHNSRHFTTSKCISLPDNEENGKFPIVYTNVGGSRPVLWYYPIGTRVIEVIGVTHSGLGVPNNGNSYDYPFEIRNLIRTKDSWTQEVFRQTWSVEELISDAKRWGFDDYADKLSKVELKQIRMRDTIHPRPTIDVMGPHFVLPENMPLQFIANLLDKPLRIDYNEDYGFTSSEPTFIPAAYRGSHVGNDGGTETCMKCHQHVGKHVDDFGPIGRDWYGFVRGSDGIFSWHPFLRVVANSSNNPNAISNNGQGGIPTIDPALLRSGIIEKYDPRKHMIERYTRIKGFR